MGKDSTQEGVPLSPSPLQVVESFPGGGATVSGGQAISCPCHLTALSSLQSSSPVPSAESSLADLLWGILAAPNFCFEVFLLG